MVFHQLNKKVKLKHLDVKNSKKYWQRAALASTDRVQHGAPAHPKCLFPGNPPRIPGESARPVCVNLPHSTTPQTWAQVAQVSRRPLRAPCPRPPRERLCTKRGQETWLVGPRWSRDLMGMGDSLPGGCSPGTSERCAHTRHTHCRAARHRPGAT